MRQSITDNVQIMYDPIQTVFDVLAVGAQLSGGGQLSQQQDMITGAYDPDRTLFPTVLTPTLLVTDPNTGESGVEKIGVCTVTWYIQSGNVYVSDPDDYPSGYELDGKNLVVSANVPAGEVRKMYVEVIYTNENTGPQRFRKDISLSTSAYLEFSPTVAVNAPLMTTVNPLRLSSQNQQMTVTASFYIGNTDYSTDSNIVYVWEKKDGANYRAITSTDIEVISIATRSVTINGVATTVQYRTFVIDLGCVGNVKYRCTAYHASYQEAQFKATEFFTFNRELYGDRIDMNITRGKYLKSSTRESSAEVSCYVNSGKISNPSDFYRFKWTFYLQSGSTTPTETVLGWGLNATVDRSKTGTDKTKVPTFKVQPYELSEFQLLIDDSSGSAPNYNGIVTDDSGSTSASDYSGYVIGQIIKDS